MSIRDELTIYYEESEERYRKLNIRLNKVGKSYLIPKFAIYQFHLNELDCINNSILAPKLAEIFTKEGPQILPPVKDGLISVIPHDYKIDIELQVLTKSSFFIARICFEDFLEISNSLNDYIQKEPNGKISPKNFKKFSEYYLDGSYRNLDERIVRLLDEYFLEIAILRSIRNYLKKEGILLFDLRYSEKKYYVQVKFEFEKFLDDTIEEMIERGLIKLEENWIFFNLEQTNYKLFRGLALLKQTMIDIILEKVNIENEVTLLSNPNKENKITNDLAGIFEQDYAKLNLKEGTFMFVLEFKVLHSAKNGVENLIQHNTEEGRFCVNLRNGVNLFIFHEYHGIKTIIDVNCSEHLKEKNIITILWDIDSNLELYIEQNLISTQKMKV